MEMCSMVVECVVSGYHAYMGIWGPETVDKFETELNHFIQWTWQIHVRLQSYLSTLELLIVGEVWTHRS